ncbi:MAG: pyridoxamine 5'-phosphate oxidase family protein [bacterium]|nr:pyridoxamine 5'-phosphate oxidase family protein [bacterium]
MALASIDLENGGPFLSLTGVAGLMDVTPTLLIADISRHIKNLAKDSRVSLLFDGTGDHANPLTRYQGRVQVYGRIINVCVLKTCNASWLSTPKYFMRSLLIFRFMNCRLRTPISRGAVLPRQSRQISLFGKSGTTGTSRG